MQPVAPSSVFPTQAQQTSKTEPPKKYIKIDGVTQLNPDFLAYRQAQGQSATTALNPGKALPVVSNMDQHQQLRSISLQADQQDVPLSASADAAIELLQHPNIVKKVGLSPDAAVDGLGEIFVKFEVPIGLMQKLAIFSNFDELEFIVDDSGSMKNDSDTKDLHGRIQTRWEEVYSRLKEILEVLAYVPTPSIRISFLNRQNVLSFQRNGETPELFLQNAYRQLDAVFNVMPDGGTPVRECLEASFQRGQGKRIARYLFCDGEPNGGKSDQKAITAMVTHRSDPEGNPVTFLSCTNQDSEVEWMKEAEEIAPYCAELDDFEDEAREVLKDQGAAFPFTRGFHLIAQIVAAMYPDDLDAMDESVPFTKLTLDNLLGIQTTEPEYRHYFREFQEAQSQRTILKPSDEIKAKQNWELHYSQFLHQDIAKNIDAVKEFKASLRACLKKT